jgi:hypothetical protein
MRTLIKEGRLGKERMINDLETKWPHEQFRQQTSTEK